MPWAMSAHRVHAEPVYTPKKLWSTQDKTLPDGDRCSNSKAFSERYWDHIFISRKWYKCCIIIFSLVSHCNFLFIPCARLSWLYPSAFYCTLSYRIVLSSESISGAAVVVCRFLISVIEKNFWAVHVYACTFISTFLFYISFSCIVYCHYDE